MATALHDPLMAARLGVPARGARTVDRPRLRERLDGMPEARLVLVAAPAGFGKSTLLADWLRASDARAAWLALDARDDDPARLVRALVAAAARLAGSADDGGLVDPTQPFDPELALAAVLGAVALAAERAPAGGAVLVLDDYHLVGDPAAHRLVAEVVDRLPARARLAISTRADPPLPLARLRARGELVEVRAEDLRFTPSEAAELLRAAAVDLDAADVEALTERTEGWAAALRLAAVSLRDRPDRAASVQRFGASHRFVLDYVVEEVLGALPPATQEFLLRTSILERLSGPLCDAVTGRNDGRERLEELERSGLPLLPLDDERRWYRYHALFAEVLRARLAMVRADETAGLHARAAAWLAVHGDDDGAVAHALRADDPAAATGLVAAASLRRLNAGDIGTVRRWLDALPDAAVRGDAQLSTSYAWCLVLPGETAGVAERLADAERALAGELPPDPVEEGMVRTQLALVRSRLADLRGDPATAVAEARRARELLPAELSPEAETTLRGDATILLARALASTGEADAAIEEYAASLPDLRAGRNLFAVGRAIADLAGFEIERGDPAAAVRRCEEELERQPPETAARTSGAVWGSLARARLALGDTGGAQAAAERALELATRAGDAQVVRGALALLARLRAPRVGPAGSGGAAGSTGTPPPTGSADDRLVEPLTARELEVLRLVARGRSNAQIAAELFVTVGTVKSHVHAIAGKLGAANRVEAAARARDLGLLE
jgi:LuxR family maltose regulon positive regulatory protein